MSPKTVSLPISWFFLAVSALASWALVPPDPVYFPSLAISLILITISALVYFFKPSRTIFDHVWCAFTILFSLFISLRAQPFLTFLNLWGAFFFGSLLILPALISSSLINFLFAPVISFTKVLTAKNNYPYDKLFNQPKVNINKEIINPVSVIVSFVVLIIIVPLLSSANPFFNTLVQDLLHLLSLQDILKRFLETNFLLHTIRLLAFFVFAILLPRIVSLVFSEHSADRTELPLPFSLFLPKMLTVIILVIFFITQAQLYFASNETLVTLGYTHSQYAREVFGQLFVVSLVIFALIYADKNSSPRSKLITTILIVQGFFLDAIALKSVYDYSVQWGLTHKRLWGYTGVVWVVGTYFLFVRSFVKKWLHKDLIKAFAIWTGAILLCVNAVNFDFLIYRYAKATTHTGTDYDYLSRLSPDAHAYRDLLEKLMIVTANPPQDSSDHYRNIYSLQRVLSHIEKLKDEYSHRPLVWRSLHFSQWREYMSIKDLNLETYQIRLQELVGNPNLSKNSAEPVAAVLVIIDNLPQADLSRYFWETYTQTNYTDLQRGNFANNSFTHTHGPGNFILLIYRRDVSGQELLLARIPYSIEPEETQKHIVLPQLLLE